MENTTENSNANETWEELRSLLSNSAVAAMRLTTHTKMTVEEMFKENFNRREKLLRWIEELSREGNPTVTESAIVSLYENEVSLLDRYAVEMVILISYFEQNK